MGVLTKVRRKGGLVLEQTDGFTIQSGGDTIRVYHKAIYHHELRPEALTCHPSRPLYIGVSIDDC